jgi:phage terminase large subunit GpA-like protein
MWVLELVKIMGDPAKPEVWEKLDAFLQKTYRHPWGSMKISSAGVDLGGHHTNMVYEFTGGKQDRLIFAVKGTSTYGCPIISNPSRNKKGVYTFNVGTDTVKNQIASGLKIPEPGPGYIHFPLTLQEDYFKQLCAESMQSRYKQGKKQYFWSNTKRVANEALDTMVYAVAALSIIQIWVFPENTVTQMLEKIRGGMEANKVEPNQPEESVPQKRRSRMISEGIDINDL